jgi:hypothetical protein
VAVLRRDTTAAGAGHLDLAHSDPDRLGPCLSKNWGIGVEDLFPISNIQIGVHR